eukprot:m.479169 g.479169  ORF g.479169 m.479169 type:complete len:196 (-) comp48579_c0_seq1:332-919(-)
MGFQIGPGVQQYADQLEVSGCNGTVQRWLWELLLDFIVVNILPLVFSVLSVAVVPTHSFLGHMGERLLWGRRVDLSRRSKEDLGDLEVAVRGGMSKCCVAFHSAVHLAPWRSSSSRDSTRSLWAATTAACLSSSSVRSGCPLSCTMAATSTVRPRPAAVMRGRSPSCGGGTRPAHPISWASWVYGDGSSSSSCIF